MAFTIINQTGSYTVPSVGANGEITKFMVFQNRLYATGDFTKIGGVTAHGFASFDGNQWSSAGLNEGRISDLIVFQKALYIRASIDACNSTAYENWWDCEFTPFYLQYDGIQWEEVIVENGLTSISTSFDHYHYEAYFPFAGNRDGSYMAGHQNKLYFKSGYWEDNHFQEFAYPIEKVFTMQTFDEELYVGGLYQKAGARNNGMLKWDGQRWSTFGDGIDGRVMAIERFQGKLYIGGKFDQAGGQPAANIIIWNEN